MRAFRAQSRLTHNHKQNLKSHQDKIFTSKIEEQEQKQEQEQEQEQRSDTAPEATTTTTTTTTPANANDDLEQKNLRDEELRNCCIEDYKNGGYSPKMYRKDQLDPSVVCVDYSAQYEALKLLRNRVCGESSALRPEEQSFMDEARKGMDKQEESVFSCEAAIKGPNNSSMSYAWADKYQPRKPRYFNRIHTGFEWNKYNQTHYDVDNPPPKVVQGYKFNIFYPDLIDKSKAPQFSITPCKEDKDFCIIRFSSGPPYEDIAFKIVNREWNNSHKSGYRCQFINNMLQLWFQFKRYRYRR